MAYENWKLFRGNSASLAAFHSLLKNKMLLGSYYFLTEASSHVFALDCALQMVVADFVSAASSV